MCDSNSLVRQNQELRDRLNEDAAVYRRRIDTYRQAQQNQAALVARLQSKVLQYRRKYNDLEERICDVPSTTEMTSAMKVSVSHCSQANLRLCFIPMSGSVSKADLVCG